MITIALLAVALAVLFWPSEWPTLTQVQPEAAPKPTFRRSIDSISYVRSRLLATDSLTDKEKAAIDTLTLALVSGSDAE